ncbi:MAG: hypothetical protein ABSF32_04020 [Ignavibacteria bacterium]|jgi:TM2 domain-containing membrane protein YozV
MKKRMLFLYVTLIISLTFSANAYSQNLKHSSVFIVNHSFLKIDSTPVKLHEKSPFLAGSLSFILPGLAAGQLYNEQYGKFLLHLGISGLCFFLFTRSFGFGGDAGSTVSLLCFAGYLFNWVFTIVDAVASANRINDEIVKQKQRTVLKKFNIGFGLNRDKQFNFKISWTF